MERTGTPVPPISIGTTTDTKEALQAPIEQDNWKHRSANMRCGTCMFFVEKSTSKAQIEDYLIGRCRQCSPTIKGWPVVFFSDWCGAHKLDEEKI